MANRAYRSNSSYIAEGVSVEFGGCFADFVNVRVEIVNMRVCEWVI